MEHHWKKHLATWGLESASPVSVVNKNCTLDRHTSPKQNITKIASVMMWELTLNEWEKTVLLNSVLDASFFRDAWWSRAYSMSVDYCYRQRRFESPRGQMFFFNDVPWRNNAICIIKSIFKSFKSVYSNPVTKSLNCRAILSWKYILADDAQNYGETSLYRKYVLG